MKRPQNAESKPLTIDPDRSETAVIQKSAPLLALWNSPLSLSELKILDVYLARIDSRTPEQRWVRFSKGDLENLLGIQKINISDLQKRIEHLGVMVRVVENFDEREFRSVALFEEAVCKQDEDGLWQIDLKCTTGAMKYIFNVEGIGYLRYKLRSVIHLGSRYSYLMFLYLERNRFRGEWEVSLDDLRNFLGCANSATYTQYKYFNREVLKRCKTELETKTSCRFTYAPVKRGIHVRAVHFKLEPLPEDTFYSPPISFASEELPAGESLPDEENYETPHMTSREFIIMACTPKNSDRSEFSSEEINQLMALLPMIPLSRLPVIDMIGPARNDLVFRWYHYLAEKYAELNRISSQKLIKNRFAYLLRMIREDIKRTD